MAAELLLSVFVIDLGSPVFSVKIKSSNTVDELKKEILKENANALKNVDAAQLTLWKVHYF